MKYLIRTILTPTCWIRNHKTNKELSKYIRAQLKQGNRPVLTNIGFCLTLGDKTLWAENYPYAFGNIYQQDYLGMPDRKTVFMLWDALQESIFTEE